MVFWKKKQKVTVALPSEGMAASSNHSSNSEYGIMTFADPSNATIDIVFVHGLTGDRESTWAEHREDGKLWPRDMLPPDIPTSRIMTFGYDADVVRLIDSSSTNTIRDHGKALATDLCRKRWLDGSRHRPLIFVVHSLGGLVCEQALLVSRGAADPWMNALLDSNVGIIFLGTPHTGSDLADWASILAKYSSILRPTNRSIVHVLQPGSEMLANLQQEFHIMLDARQSQGKPVPRIYCFFEELPYNTIVGLVVPRHSAILTRYNNQGIHANHVSMTKFGSAKDQGYRNIRDQLCIWVMEIESGSYDDYAQQPSSSAEQRLGQLGGSSHVYSGSVISNGGQVIQGNVTSGDLYIGPNRERVLR